MCATLCAEHSRDSRSSGLHFRNFGFDTQNASNKSNRTLKFLTPLRGCSIQGSRAVIIADIDIGTTLDEKIGHFKTTQKSCSMQGGVAIIILCIKISTLVNQ